MPNLVAATTFEVYGLGIRVGGEWPEVIEELRRDFAWFESPLTDPHTDVEITVEQGPPDFDHFGDLRAAFVTPRNVVYQRGSLTIVDYFGRAISVLDRAKGELLVQGEDLHLVREAAYLYLLSRIGEHLDRRGLTRLHALGLSGAQGGVALMLPSGGGKSTFALLALREQGVKLLSEDTPLIDRRGYMHPFPLRLGINATDADLVPNEGVRRIERMEFHPKLVLDIDAFGDRIEEAPQPLLHLVIGQRALGQVAELERLPRSAAVGTLFREAVVGVGVYQGMEFILQRGLRDVAGKAGVARMRAARCFAALAKAQVWRLTLGRDRERNWRALEPLLR